ncbi:exonuclease domain-containing protein [Nocardia sp. NRRL WC-3656]|uniref:exonuclease domain-containing protein n=1 Tax=Nocardia sp. NRRL WC-3656 TaxID=1463824 RepID=UPI0009E07024
MSNGSAAQPGWYADPSRHVPLRWFDGFRWTDAVSNVPGWYPDPWQEAPYRWFDGHLWTDVLQPPAVHHPPAPLDPGAGASTSIRSVAGVAPQLASLLGTASRFAVMDVETTGLRHSDRVVEITVLTLDHSGTVTNTFDTVVNPMRDVGPTWIHGLTAADVAGAPTFGEIAHAVAELLDGAIVVAHNRPFDTRMVGFELERSGIDVQWGSGLDTLAVTRCKLAAACLEHGVQHENQHRALGDARAPRACCRPSQVISRSRGPHRCHPVSKGTQRQGLCPPRRIDRPTSPLPGRHQSGPAHRRGRCALRDSAGPGSGRSTAHSRGADRASTPRVGPGAR